MRTAAFSARNIKELLRDPISYIFCLGFPVIMLIVMTAVNKSIPPQANMTIFNIENLSSGIAVFGLTFVMLFTALQVSKDRSSAFLIRLYASPMKPAEFILGYTFPLIIVAAAQCIITYAASFIIGIATEKQLDVLPLITATFVLIPSAVMFIGFGLLFGSIFNDKAAPGLCSIVISLSCMLGGIWMDVDNLDGGLKKICEILPFYHSVRTGRMAVSGNYEGFAKSMIIVAVYAIIIYVLSVLVFNMKMRKDKK
ncbi:MAG: ABC transporter permease [Oscillospiraceae bacterium]